jgi:TetR/AcrR family transcriptional regulator
MKQSPKIEAATPSSVPRRKGRPQLDGDAAVGREAVVAATRQMLKRSPPVRISRAEIAREVGVDPSLIRYYFGNKSSLLTAVILQISQEAANRQFKNDPSVPFADQLKRRMGTWIEMLSENPQLHNLVVQRVIYGEETESEDLNTIRNEIVSKWRSSLQELIDQGVRRGEIRPVDVNMLHVAFIGLFEFAVNAFPLFGLLEGKALDRSETLARYVDFVVDLLMRGLAVPSR